MCVMRATNNYYLCFRLLTLLERSMSRGYKILRIDASENLKCTMKKICDVKRHEKWARPFIS